MKTLVAICVVFVVSCSPPVVQSRLRPAPAPSHGEAAARNGAKTAKPTPAAPPTTEPAPRGASTAAPGPSPAGADPSATRPTLAPSTSPPSPPSTGSATANVRTSHDASVIFSYVGDDSPAAGAPRDLEVELTAGGKKVEGDHRVRLGEKKTFSVPAGVVSYRARGEEGTFDVAANGTAEVECLWTTAGTFCGLVEERGASVSAKTARVEITYDSSNPGIDLTFFVDGKKVDGKFPVRTKTASFTVPAGKLRWHAFGDPKDKHSCEGGGDPSKELDLAAGETALLECWQSAKMGDCCTEKKRAAGPAKKK